jgi:peptidase M28-like protein
MRKMAKGFVTAIFVWAAFMVAGPSSQTQTPPKTKPARTSAARPAATPTSATADEYLQWPLPPGGQAYGRIDGKHLHTFVVEQAAISRRYRDAGHPKFWGRIIGTSSDAESGEWLAAKFKALGMSDVHIQPFDLQPQWIPQSWDVAVTGAGKTLRLESAQPDYGAAPTPSGGLDLDAVYVGLGTEADYAGKDVKGKAVFYYTQVGLQLGTDWTALQKRADAKGAAAIFEVDMLPGNMRYQGYPSNTKAPAFTVGSGDGFAVRDLFAAAAGQPLRAKVNLNVQMVPNLKTSLVWGTLAGATDETIYIMAHRDGWFDASGDNAAGVAAMIGLAEYYAKVPQAQRKRTMVFIGLDGHHNSGAGAAAGGRWLSDNRDKLFAKTALVINAEHPAAVQTYVRPRYEEQRDIAWSNTYIAQQWYAGGAARPELQAIAVKAFHDFGVPLLKTPNAKPPLGDLGRVYRFTPGVATSEFYHFFHTDQETPETVPWTGLEATTRAYAKIIDEVNKLPLSSLQRPPEPDPPPPTAAPKNDGH